MMNLAKIVFLLVAACSSLNAEESSGNRPCAGGQAHGSQVNMGKYWYECRDAQMVPKGCLTDTGSRIEIDATYNTNEYQVQCVLGSDGFLTMVYKACVFQNGARDVGSQWDDNTAFYTCVKEGSNVRVVMLGCVDQGKPMKFDERVAKGDFIYQCKKAASGSPVLNKVGCVHEGRKYNVGEAVEGAEYWYTCTDSGVQVQGCMYQSHRLQSGDHFTSGDLMFACSVTSEGAKLEPYACLARAENGAAVERKVGCSWVEGDFEYICKVDGSKVAKTKAKCFYKSSQGSFKISPGCVRLAETFAVGCSEAGSGDLRMETYPADQIDRLPGLRQC